MPDLSTRQLLCLDSGLNGDVDDTTSLQSWQPTDSDRLYLGCLADTDKKSFLADRLYVRTGSDITLTPALA